MGSGTDGIEVSLRGRRRPSGGADLLLHQKAQHQPLACTRRSRGEKEVKKSSRRRRRRRRTAGAGEENRDPNDLTGNMGTQTPRRDHRRFSQSATGTRTPVKTGFGFISGSEIQFCRPEVRKALVRKTMNQTSVQNLVQGLILTDKTDLQSPETQMDKRRPSQVRPTQVRSRSTAGPLETAGVVSDQSLRSRTSRRRSERGLGLEFCRREGLAPRIRSRSEGRRPETRRRKIHPSVFRGRGQLRLSITPEAGQLIIHIYEARGLLGKSQRSCDSYVEVSVTSDVNCSIMMKTPTVLNNKNPEYNHSLILGISDDLILSRLLVSVFSRCSRLIGCMSFGIDSCILSPKFVTGWFYLLGEEFGRRKHLRLTSQRNKPIRSRDDRSEGILPTYYNLRRTPDSAPDADLNHITTAAATPNLSNASTTTAGLKDLRNHGLTSSCPHSHDPTNANYSKYISVLYANTTRNSTQQLTVNVVRGKDGFGFTICSDCPVRVQAVDSGGPAHESGLRQGDSILQLNGIPVETWKCVDLAHAIRSCPSQIVLVVWRGLPELRTGCEALLRPPTHHSTSGRKLLPHPTHSKHGRRRGQGLGVRSSLGALGSLWRDKKEEQKEGEEEQETSEFPTTTTTLKGTRVTSSHGDNYIILSPVNSGAQLLQPVYHDRNGTIGRLYQTHPSRGQNLLQDPRPSSMQRPFTGHTSTKPPPLSSSSSTLPSNYGNYQNCTIVQSHLPCSSYGTYVTLAPKTLIFPIFVQPLDLCSPDRTLLMAEEMVLHQADLLPAKVTVLIYSDLMLFTREDEAGRCNVLQSPLYLNTLQLREVSSEPLQIYFLQSSQDCWHYLVSLEAFSVEQKVRVSLCLHDNIQLQMVAMETGHSQEFPGLPSDFGLLSLHQSDLLYRPSSPYPSSDPALLCPSVPYSSFCDSLRPPSPSPYCPSSPFFSSSPPPSFSSLSPHTNSSPPPQTHAASSQHQPLPPPSSSTHKSTVWKERGGAGDEEERRRRRHEEEVEERQQGEGESASETSENVGGVGGQDLLFNPHPLNMKGHEEEESDADEEEEEGVEEVASSCRPEVVSVLRRSLSVGSLLQEPRSPRFLSDSTIHRLTHPMTFDLDPGPGPQPPSINTLRKQLTREGGSLHHMLLLLNGTMDAELRNLKLKKKTKSLTADVRSHLPFLRRRKNGTSIHGNSLEKALRNNRPSTEEVLRWGESLEALLTNQYGLAVFRHFLRSEFSEENLDFWLAVERFKRTSPVSKMAARAAKIYDEFISTNAARQVNVDSSVRDLTNQSLRLGVNHVSFQPAQDQIFGLMETDSYPRFLKSRLYAQLANHGTEMATESAN